MWLENSVWGMVALHDMGEVGRGQVKQDLWLMLGSLESGHEQAFECNLIGMKHRKGAGK